MALQHDKEKVSFVRDVYNGNAIFSNMTWMPYVTFTTPFQFKGI